MARVSTSSGESAGPSSKLGRPAKQAAKGESPAMPSSPAANPTLQIAPEYTWPATVQLRQASRSKTGGLIVHKVCEEKLQRRYSRQGFGLVECVCGGQAAHSRTSPAPHLQAAHASTSMRPQQERIDSSLEQATFSQVFPCRSAAVSLRAGARSENGLLFQQGGS